MGKRAAVPKAAAKKAKADAARAAARAGVRRLSADQMAGLLEQLVDRDDRCAALVAAEVEKLDARRLDVQSFGSSAYRALHQLDQLRPSQQYDQSGRVSEDLRELIRDAQTYSPAQALRGLARIAGVLSHAPETGEVFKCVTSCGGVQADLADALGAQIAQLPGPAAELREALAQLERVDARLGDYGIEDFAEVVDALRPLVL